MTREAWIAPPTVGWRAHTFADGVRAITLTDPLDAATAGRLWSRLSEIAERGCRRVIVDASAIHPRGNEPALLASAFADRPASWEAVVVAPRGSPLLAALPAWIGIAWTLSDARSQLASGLVRHDTRARPGPGGLLPSDERNALIARQSLRWAEASAREGDYERALALLASVERIDRTLAPYLRERRRAWSAGWRASAVARAREVREPARRRGRHG